MTVLAERVKINKDAEFESLHPRDSDGQFRDRIGGALRKLTEAFGEIVSHDQFGEPDHDRESHGVMTLHQDGTITVAAIDEQGEHGVILRADQHAALGELRDTISIAADDAETADEILSYDYSEEFGHTLDVSYGRYGHGDPFVSLDSEERGFSLSPEYAHDFVTMLGDMEDLQRSHVGGDPSVTRPLPATESLERRRVIAGKDDQFTTMAGLVSAADGPHLRLGVVALGDGGAREWTGGRGQTTVDLGEEHAAALADALEEFDTAGKARQKVYDRFTAEYDALPEDAPQEAYDAISARVNAELGGDFEDDFEERKIETSWGTIRLTDVGMTDEANAHPWHVRVEIWPAGMTEEQYDAGQAAAGGPDWAWPGAAERYEKPKADLEAKDVRALVKMLRTTFTEGGRAAIAKSARGAARKVDRNRIAREGRKYWTRSPKGLKKWARSAHPWTALHRHLATKMDPETADRLTSSYFRAVFGYAPSARQGKNPVGKG